MIFKQVDSRVVRENRGSSYEYLILGIVFEIFKANKSLFSSIGSDIGNMSVFSKRQDVFIKSLIDLGAKWYRVFGCFTDDSVSKSFLPKFNSKFNTIIA